MDHDQAMKTSVIAEAERIAQEHGKARASWVFDGNTPEVTYQTVLKGINDGDPQIYDMFSPPDLSGEFADDYDAKELQSDLGIEIDVYRDDAQGQTELLDEAANAYNEAASDAFWHEVERLAREHLS